MKIRTILIGIILLSLAFVTGTYFGFRQAPAEFYSRDAQFKASLMVYEIQKLKAGEIDALVEAKEVVLDTQLAWYGHYLESKQSWILALVQPVSDADDSAIRHAAPYRFKHPFTGPDLSNPQGWEKDVDMSSAFAKEVIEGQRENARLVKMVVDRYAVK